MSSLRASGEKNPAGPTPSHSIAIVRDSSHRSTRLPALCDACLEMISEYPYIAKHSTNGHHRKYHVACALRIGLILSFPTLGMEEVLAA